MIGHLQGRVDLFIHPGEYEFADEHFCLRTTLGSCVAITLWHPKRRLGAMCHFMLPERGRTSADEELNPRYADDALELMFREARRHHTKPYEYEVKVFGGGNMFPSAIRRTGPSIAARNMEAADRILKHAGLRVRARHVGGSGYRNIIFDIASGEVWVRHVALKRVAGWR